MNPLRNSQVTPLRNSPCIAPTHPSTQNLARPSSHPLFSPSIFTPLYPSRRLTPFSSFLLSLRPSAPSAPHPPPRAPPHRLRTASRRLPSPGFAPLSAAALVAIRGAISFYSCAYAWTQMAVGVVKRDAHRSRPVALIHTGATGKGGKKRIDCKKGAKHFPHLVGVCAHAITAQESFPSGDCAGAVVFSITVYFLTGSQLSFLWCVQPYRLVHCRRVAKGSSQRAVHKGHLQRTVTTERRAGGHR